MESLLFLISCLLFLVKGDVSSLTGKDITDQAFKDGENVDILPAAYGDMNGDKVMDMVALNKIRTELKFFLGRKNSSPYFTQNVANLKGFHNGDGNIGSIILGDFDGNGFPDILITSTPETIVYSKKTFVAGNCTGNKTKHEMTLSYHVRGIRTTYLCLAEDGGNLDFNCTKFYPGQYLVQPPMIGDFDGDFLPDLLGEIWKDDNHTESSLNHNYTDDNNCSCTFLYQNKTHIVKEKTVIWLSAHGGEIVETNVFDGKNSSYPPMTNPSSNAFADVNSDLNPELVMIVDNSTETNSHFFREVYQVNYNYNLSKENKKHNPLNFTRIGKPLELPGHVFGTPLFLDLERKGERLIHIIPYCSGKGCHKDWGLILVGGGSSTVHQLSLASLAYYGEQLWYFPISTPISHNNETSCSISFGKGDHDLPCNKVNRTSQYEETVLNQQFTDVEDFYFQRIPVYAADYNSDGYPDLLTVLESSSSNPPQTQRKAVVFENVACKGKCQFPRTFEPNFDLLSQYENVISASFFDLTGNGDLDIVLVLEDKPGSTKVQVFEINSISDSYFLKVAVSSSASNYGNLIPGAIMRYRINDYTDPSSIFTQAYRTCPLDLPFTLFSIGHPTSYINELDISVGSPHGVYSSPFTHQLRELIPNSHIVVVPRPEYNKGTDDNGNNGIPSPLPPTQDDITWRVILFLSLTDSSVVGTFGVLLGLLTFCIFVASALEYGERAQDRKERMSEARKFLSM